MIYRFCLSVLAALVGAAITGGAASAHPHVWVTVKSELVYAPDGSVTGVRHAWTFDDMFSVFALQGLESKKKGEFTREELAPLAEVNVKSLKEYDFFTYAKANGKKVEFNDPQAGYYLDYDHQGDGADAVLHAAAQGAGEGEGARRSKSTTGNISSTSAFAEKDPVKLVGAPAQCKLSVARPQEMSAALAQQLSQLGPDQRDPDADRRRRIRQQDSGEMSVKPVVGGRPVVHFALVIAALAGLMLVAGALDAAFAQGGPFGAPRAQAPAPPMGGVLGWIFAKQAEFYRQFSSLIRAAKADGSAAWGLFGLSFLYGIFHAAGPGHGKAVISSYMVANEETWVRGVVLSFASALLQALVAVVLVGIAAALLNATAATMKRAVDLIEILSYSLIILIGVRLLWVKGRVFLATLRTLHRPAAVGAAVTPAHALHDHGHHDHQHDHASRSCSCPRPRSCSRRS